MRKTLLFIVVLAFTKQLSAQYNLPLWSVGNANLSPRRTFVFNSTFTSRYNLNGNIQLASNLLIFPVAPNFQTKILVWDKTPSLKKRKFYSQWRWRITTVHTIVIPTYAFRLNGKINLVSLPYSGFPLNLTMENDIFMTIPWSKKYFRNCDARFITLKAGWRHTFGADTTLPVPDQGFWKLQTSTFKTSDFYFIGITYDTKWRNNLNFSQTFKAYALKNQGYALESTSFVYFGFGLKKHSVIAFGVSAGYLSRYKQPYIKLLFNYSYKLKPRTKRKKDLDV